MRQKGWLVLEDGKTFGGNWWGGAERAGEVVFNTSHSGYEEMATDPSYSHQILVTTAPMQGNYGVTDDVWESEKIWIEGFVCLQMQNSSQNASWKSRLLSHEIPILSDLDTRELVLHLRDNGTPWGALVQAKDASAAQTKAKDLIGKQKKVDLDWAYAASTKKFYSVAGAKEHGPRVAVIDFGCKKNIIRELALRCREVGVFPSRATSDEIKKWNPDGILLSNGPGDPKDVQQAPQTVRELLGWRFIFGICMGHQILGLALGGQTARLKFGHRGSNHPIKDELLKQIYMTSQNHSYVLVGETLPKDTTVTHTNLNDHSVAGIYLPGKKCLSVQFHPESHPGPHEAETLFDYFIRQLT